MSCAADFKRTALDALRGKWLIAIAAGVIAALLGGVGTDGTGIKIRRDGSSGNICLQYNGQSVFSLNEGFHSEWAAMILGSTLLLVVIVILLGALFLVLGSVVEAGYALFNLDLVDGVEPRIETLFTYFYNWKTTTVASLLRSLYIFLWSLLFIVPGIYAAYSYAMTGYVLAEHPELTAGEALAQSKQLMEGNRFRLFCLQISFIGLDILSAFTFGIGNFWLTPYKQAATAGFYREISL